MGVKRRPTDEPDSKKARVTLEEEVIVIMDDLEEEEVADVKDEARLKREANGELVEPNTTDSVIFVRGEGNDDLVEANTSADSLIFLLHICFLCDMELDCAPGDIVMKNHYISHYSPGSMFLNSSLAHVINTRASTCTIYTC